MEVKTLATIEDKIKEVKRLQKKQEALEGIVDNTIQSVRFDFKEHTPIQLNVSMLGKEFIEELTKLFNKLSIENKREIKHTLNGLGVKE